jgi:hypothetical protein
MPLMSHCCLIYTSTASEKFVSNDELRKLVQQCAENNRRAKIAGLLLLAGDQFLQVLEGPSKAVNTLLRKICMDKRHHDLDLVSFEPIGPVYFDNWSMRLVDLYDLPMESRQIFMRKYQHDNGVIQIPNRLHEGSIPCCSMPRPCACPHPGMSQSPRHRAINSRSRGS